MHDYLKTSDIDFSNFHPNEIPQFHPSEVWLNLIKLKTNKATVPGDLPARLNKEFAAYLVEPFTDIVNTCIRRGEYPEIYKYEVCTPVPKKFPPKEVKQMRNISGLLNFDKLLEKMLCKLLVADMKEKADPSQFGNEQGTSVQHYLISMLHRILSVLDCNSEKHKFAVIANLIDWN